MSVAHLHIHGVVWQTRISKVSNRTLRVPRSEIATAREVDEHQVPIAVPHQHVAGAQTPEMPLTLALKWPRILGPVA
jgi:hypothetical protein